MKKLKKIMAVLALSGFMLFGVTAVFAEETDNKVREMANETYAETDNKIREMANETLAETDNKIREMSLTEIVAAFFGI